MTIKASSVKNLQVDIQSGNHQWRIDEPLTIGGDDSGPNPYDALLGALAACKIITVHMYARRKGWPLDGIDLTMSTQKVHARDCEDCESDPNAKVDLIETEIAFQGDLDKTQLERLLDISEKCPVHRTLNSETVIRTKLMD